MAKTSPTFFRKFEVFASIKNILEPVNIILGFSGPVDSESGMILNLADIDAWIAKFRATALKPYEDSWELVQSVNKIIKSKMKFKEFASVQFDFLDRSVLCERDSLYIAWEQPSLVVQGKKRWKSRTCLTMKLDSPKWPPLTPFTDKKILKALKKVDLNKMKWSLAGFRFSSFVYFDPEINGSLKIS